MVTRTDNKHRKLLTIFSFSFVVCCIVSLPFACPRLLFALLPFCHCCMSCGVDSLTMMDDGRAGAKSPLHVHVGKGTPVHVHVKRGAGIRPGEVGKEQEDFQKEVKMMSIPYVIVTSQPRLSAAFKNGENLLVWLFVSDKSKHCWFIAVNIEKQQRRSKDSEWQSTT